MFSQGGHDQSSGPPAQPFLLGATPPFGPGSPADGRSRGQIFADVVEVAQEVSLGSKNFPALQANPGGPVGHGVNPAVEPPAGLARAMSPLVNDSNRRGRALSFLSFGRLHVPSHSCISLPAITRP